MRVLITGSSGCLARVLIPALWADAAIERITGIDVKSAAFAHDKFNPVQMDIADAGSSELFAGHDALVHMACVVLRGRMSKARMHEVNVKSSMRVFEHAAAHGVKRLILISSAAVYGSGVDLTEDAALNPLPGFSYGQDKAELERQIQAAFPDCLRLRPHVILGPNAQPLLRFLLRLPLYPRLPAAGPLLQCVHELDVAAAIMLALRSRVAGALNLAAPEPFSFGTAIRQLHPRALPMPVALAQTILNVSWRLTGFGGEPGWMNGLRQPLTLNCERARRELGWLPSYSAAAAISATAR
jgi:UDP-glucose 4-epimerase